VRIDHKDRARDGAHPFETAQVLLEAIALFLEARDLLLEELLVRPVLLHALERPEPVEALLDRAEVREGAAEPAVRHEVHAAALRLLDDDVLRLALRAHEEHAAAATHGVDDKIEGLLEEARRLVEINDVDPVPGAVDVRAHLRVPALGLVAEVDACVEERPQGERELAALLSAGRGIGGRRGGRRGCGYGDISHGFNVLSVVPPLPARDQPRLRGGFIT